MHPNTIVRSAIVLLFSASPVFAGSPLPPLTPPTPPAATITAEKKALILELLKVTEADQRVDQIVRQIMAAHQRQYPLLMAQVVNSDPNLTEAQKKEVIEKAHERSVRSSERMKELFLQKIDLAKVMDEVALQVYDKNFTEPELKDIITFYKTPTGQKALKKMPAVMQESMDMTAKLIAQPMGQIIQQLMEEARTQLPTDKSGK